MTIAYWLIPHEYLIWLANCELIITIQIASMTQNDNNIKNKKHKIILSFFFLYKLQKLVAHVYLQVTIKLKVQNATLYFMVHVGLK